MGVDKFQPDSLGTTKKQCVVVQYFQDNDSQSQIARPKSRMQVAHLYLKRSSFSRSESRLSDHSSDTLDSGANGDESSVRSSLESLQLGDQPQGVSCTGTDCQLSANNNAKDVTSQPHAFQPRSSLTRDVQDSTGSSPGGECRSGSSFDFQYNAYLRDSSSSRASRPYTAAAVTRDSKPQTSWSQIKKKHGLHPAATERGLLMSGKVRRQTDQRAVSVGRAGYYRNKTPQDL